MTTETKHTRGEWKALYFDALENDGTGTLVLAGYKKRVISAVWFDEQNRRCTQFLAEVHEQAAHPEQGEANARLISTSPKLLTACKQALAILEASLEAEDPQARTQIEWEAEPLATLRAVIAEAEGAEPVLAA
jgi:hypothetical protein